MPYRSAIAVLALSITACSSTSDPPRTRDAGRGDDAAPDAPVASPCAVSAGETICVGGVETACDDGGAIASERDCDGEGLTCIPGIGCAVCQPGRGRCDGDVPSRCATDGSGWIEQPVCDAELGEACDDTSGTCSGPCADAAAEHSYLGCEYWPVPTMSSLLPREFRFAVVVASPHDREVRVTVTRGGEEVATRTIAPRGLEVIELPWVDALRGIDAGEAGVERSSLVADGAYHLRSSLPVTAYQFNPLDYRIDTDCPDELSRGQLLGDGTCDSFTADASLLLPAHAMTGSYVVLSWPSRTIRHTGLAGGPAMRTTPGFFTVTGTDLGPVDVDVKVTAFTEASIDGSIRALSPGESARFTLAPGQVLQMVTQEPTSCAPGGPTDTLPNGVVNEYCDVSRTHDLTGTTVRASGRVQVISGHSCAFVPTNRWACDHLEESVFPLESWGREAIVSISRPLRSEPNLVRIVSGHDGNTITFEPASVHAPVTLARGEHVDLESGVDFRVSGTEAFAAVQFLVGQDYTGPGTSGWMATGDPSMSLAIPTEQFRTEYTFLAPETYLQSFLNVTAREGEAVLLDGEPIDPASLVPLEGTDHAIARLEIAPGAHTITSAMPFGIVVYGFGAYTSYMVPGGLDLEPIGAPF